MTETSPKRFEMIPIDEINVLNPRARNSKNPPRKITTADLMRLYQREAEKQRLLVKKSNYTQAKLLFLVEALRELLADERFTTLLRAEHLDTMPRALTARIGGEQLE